MSYRSTTPTKQRHEQHKPQLLQLLDPGYEGSVIIRACTYLQWLRLLAAGLNTRPSVAVLYRVIGNYIAAIT